MKLSEIGERKLTYFVTEKFNIPFDDAAFLPHGKEYLVITTDMVGRKTHFPPSTTFFQMGWYAIAVNISDIAAKGAMPIAYSVAVGLPRNLEKENYEELLEGMEKCIEKYGGEIIGGDTKETNDIVIAVTAFGKVKKGYEMLRKGAKEGDAVFVTNSVGRGGAALLDNDVKKLLLIEPRLKEGLLLAEKRIATSCMDLSDGLASSLYQLARVNNLGFRIYADKIPVAKEARKHENWLELALYYGGDYELLFTAPEEKVKGIEEDIDARKIGEVIGEKKVLLVEEGKEKEMEDRGYEHFI